MGNDCDGYELTGYVGDENIKKDAWTGQSKEYGE